jgi:hypothetical protein
MGAAEVLEEDNMYFSLEVAILSSIDFSILK